MTVFISILFTYTYLIRKYLEFNFKKQNYLERISDLQRDIADELARLKLLNKKISRYLQLEGFIDDLKRCDSIADISNLLSQKVEQIFKDQETKTAFYIFHSKSGELGISFLEKDHMQIKVRSKKGDAFDQWIIKTMQSLFIADTKQDARFIQLFSAKQNLLTGTGKEKSDHANDDGEYSTDSLRSLIAAPLVVGDRAIGIVRVDGPQTNHFTFDDLELLSRLAGLGAMAIENAQLSEQTEEMAITDTLTGLYLRKYLMDRLAEEIKLAIQAKNDLSFLMIDLDHFKMYNDQFGHMAGDLVLRTVAMILADTFNDPGDLVCRYGGEEFCAFFPHCSKQKAVEKAQIFRKRIEKQTIVLRREKTHVTVSIGVATLPQDAYTSEKLIDMADQAMYRAKKEGRNRVCPF